MWKEGAPGVKGLITVQAGLAIVLGNSRPTVPVPKLLGVAFSLLVCTCSCGTLSPFYGILSGVGKRLLYS